MGTYASLQDVRNAYDRPIPADHVGTWVDGLIGQAERLLEARVPGFPQRIQDGTLPKQNVVDAVVAAVLRVVRNPEGFQSETEGNYLYSVNRDVAGGKLFFTGDDLILVRARSSGGYGRPLRSPVTR